MPAPKRGPRLGGSASNQKAMLASLSSELIRHGRITTTVAKAKAVRPHVEKLITKARRGDLHARRQALSVLRDKDVTAHLFEVVGPAFADRDGGYTRILKLGPRKGDNAPMAIIELVEDTGVYGDESIEEHKAERRSGILGRFRRGADETADA